MEQIIIEKGTQFLLDNRSFEIAMENEKDTYTVFDIEFPAVEKTFTKKKIVELLQGEKLRFSKEEKNKDKEYRKEYNSVDLSMLPIDLREKALFRFEAIKPLIDLKPGTMNPYIKAQVEKLN